jgi:hypothetical protein
MAGGAALVGLAGGMALAGRKKRRGVISRIKGSSMPKIDTSKLSMPKPDSALKAVGNAAGTVADRSHRLGQVATEVQKASDTLAKSKK